MCIRDRVRYLRDLQFTVEGRTITVPSWRDDVETMADIAEEVARIYGYDKIEPTLFAGTTTQGGLTPYQQFERDLSGACMAAGYNEVISLSFLSPKVFDKLRLPEDSSLRIDVYKRQPSIITAKEKAFCTPLYAEGFETMRLSRWYRFRPPKRYIPHWR